MSFGEQAIEEENRQIKYEAASVSVNLDEVDAEVREIENKRIASKSGAAEPSKKDDFEDLGMKIKEIEQTLAVISSSKPEGNKSSTTKGAIAELYRQLEEAEKHDACKPVDKDRQIFPLLLTTAGLAEAEEPNDDEVFRGSKRMRIVVVEPPKSQQSSEMGDYD